MGAARNLLLIVRSALERRSYTTTTTTVVFYTVSFQLRAFLNTKCVQFFFPLLLSPPSHVRIRDIETNSERGARNTLPASFDQIGEEFAPDPEVSENPEDPRQREENGHVNGSACNHVFLSRLRIQPWELFSSRSSDHPACPFSI